MDAISLDLLLTELRPLVVGRHIERVRLRAPQGLGCELSGARGGSLWLEAGRSAPLLALLERAEARALSALDVGPATGPAGHAVLLFRKHLEGLRLVAIERLRGERILLVDCGRARLAFRLGGTPALTLVVEGAPLATLGDGAPAWPLPDERPEREIAAFDPEALQSVAVAPLSERPRLALRACPPLGPALARAFDGTPQAFAALRERLATPRPTLILPALLDDCSDAALAPRDAALLAPIALERDGRICVHPVTWRDAVAALLAARRRGDAFARRQRSAVQAAERERRRQAALLRHLAQDLADQPDAARLRREGEALLAAIASVPPGAVHLRVPDPRDPEVAFEIALDPGQSAAAGADRRFEKARRVERARVEIAGRLNEARSRLAEAERNLVRLGSAERIADLPGAVEKRGRGASEAPGEKASGPRRYLTSRGLVLLVGRSARENHEITFTIAAPDDYWLHARDVPGAHVVLRDNERRAGALDLREAAELAAFFSAAAREARVDVHVARRKHVRPAGGEPGRVRIAHSETLRVAPRDPHGRLRQR
jgi:hypothetical protein